MLWTGTAVSIALAIWFASRGPRAGLWVFKPLATLCIIAIAVIALPGEPALYGTLVVAGLACSLAGDVAIEVEGERWFLAGLVSFLVAHLCYIAAFLARSHAAGVDEWTLPAVAGALVGLYAAAAYAAIRPGLGPMRVPAFVYMLALAAMAWTAALAWSADPSPATRNALAGAALFLVSDTLLAVDRFRRPLPAAQLLILATYYAAQWLIAESIG
jgi:uncharacterized membrane protein YhhN